ncbi:lipopolysaccharide biosynthesis protein [Halogeometricum borinquense]|uniref:Lipopolysaccharide biosynthesis protein n=1 Tax=Halogeometricum borinquense TaxID=60847 RepID=A0A6C0UNQ7_9EURY|nr:lipopolysaccharide biosynthesis protein [Halogeometricum borinquense]QIB75519.1 lipopolysaccharide biosynthesis protein [Halogeometricum borinquense]
MFGSLHSIYSRLTADGSAEEEAIRSGIWVTGINVGDRVLQLLKVIVLARLLSPTVFGLLGIGLVTLAGLRQFSRLGLDQALIQRKDANVDEYLNTVWIMKIARGAIIAATAFIIAPYIATFFNEPKAKDLVRVLSISPLILGLQNPSVVYFRKNLNFHKEFVYQVGARLIDAGVAIAFALVYRNVWALAAGLLASNVSKSVISYAIHSYRPNISFNMEYAKEMFGFGKWLLASSILIFLYGQGDDSFVGWFFGATTLGFYQLAYRFSNAPATEVTHVISRVTFPTYSKVQDNVDRLREGYFRAVQLSALVAFPMVAGIVAVAPVFVTSVLGDEWTPAIPLAQLLAVWGGIRAIGANIGPVLKAVGRPDYDTKIQTVKVAFILVFIYPAAETFETAGVIYVLIGSALLTMPVLYYIVLSIVDGTVSRLLYLVFYPLLGSALMFLTVTFVRDSIPTISGIAKLVLLVLVGVVSYVSIMLLVEKWLDYNVTDLVVSLRNAI